MFLTDFNFNSVYVKDCKIYPNFDNFLPAIRETKAKKLDCKKHFCCEKDKDLLQNGRRIRKIDHKYYLSPVLYGVDDMRRVRRAEDPNITGPKRDHSSNNTILMKAPPSPPECW